MQTPVVHRQLSRRRHLRRPVDLKFYGYAGPKNGGKKVFLFKGEDIFLAKEGDVVDRHYKIVHVGTTSVEVQDVLTNHTETIPLSAG